MGEKKSRQEQRKTQDRKRETSPANGGGSMWLHGWAKAKRQRCDGKVNGRDERVYGGMTSEWTKSGRRREDGSMRKGRSREI
jgi:hypothetical protein